MARPSIFAIVGAAASVFTVAAHAADAPEPFFTPAQPVVVQEFASGWYIRGDIGYRMNSVGGASTFFSDPMTSTSIDDTAVFGFGGGYKAGWFRADLTVTFVAHKPGLLRGAGPAHAGRVVVRGIGVPEDLLERGNAERGRRGDPPG